MFKSIISETPFTSQVANEYFKNITGGSFLGVDISFVATLRALLSHRVGDGETVKLKFDSSGYSESALRHHDRSTIVEVAYRDWRTSGGGIIIHNLSCAKSDASAWLNYFKENFTKECPGFVEIEKFSVFFSKKIEVRCWINNVDRKTFVLCNNLDIKTLHLLQVAIPVMVPWYFAEENALDYTSIEGDLLKSLEKTDENTYLSILSELAKEYDFRSANIRNKLEGFELERERNELESLKERIEDCFTMIRNYNSKIANAIEEKRQLEIRMSGLAAKIADGGNDSKIMNFFLSNNNIDLNRVDGYNLYFTVKGYIENYDEEAAEKYINNDSSFVYCPDGTPRSDIINKNDMKLLMKAIFIDQVLKLRVAAMYRFDIGHRVEGCENQDLGYEYKNYMPNPHIDYHACLGNYEQIINEAVLQNDYVYAISQCIASCYSLSFHDYTVMSEFMENIYGVHGDKNNCLELPDGTVTNPVSAIRWLKKQKAEQSSEEVNDNEQSNQTDGSNS